MEIPDKPCLWLLLIVDFFWIEYLLRGDQPGFRPIIYEIIVFIIYALKGIRRKEPSTESWEDTTSYPSKSILNTSRPESFTATASTPIEDILKSQAQAAKNLELNRQAERWNAQTLIEESEKRTERFFIWRNAAKFFGAFFFVFHCVLLYNAVSEVGNLRHIIEQKNLELQFIENGNQNDGPIKRVPKKGN